MITAGVAEERRGKPINEVSGAVVSAAMQVHTDLGPGFGKRVRSVPRVRVAETRPDVQTQVPLPLIYQGVKLEVGYRIDLLVDDCVIVEVKSVEALAPIHEAQVISYLKLSGRKVGLLINFNVLHLKDGIRRLVNHS